MSELPKQHLSSEHTCEELDCGEIRSVGTFVFDSELDAFVPYKKTKSKRNIKQRKIT